MKIQISEGEEYPAYRVHLAEDRNDPHDPTIEVTDEMGQLMLSLESLDMAFHQVKHKLYWEAEKKGE